LAITKDRKGELVAQYQDWIKRSEGAFVAEYTGLTVKKLEELRRIVREKGGEFHVAKNTLVKLAVKEAGLSVPENLFEGSTAVGFAFEDVAGLAKVLNEFSRTSETLKIKGGFIGAYVLNAEEVKALADLPPLPSMRARLIGLIQAPAGKLARLMAEPGRQIAAVVQAYSANAAG
jgi:large subunit ribosomal protein L10